MGQGQASSSTIKIFLAHSSRDDDRAIKSWAEEVERWAAADGLSATVVAGRDDFGAHIALEGTIDAWASGVVTRLDSFTRQREFAAIVVPSVVVGKATALIVEGALKVGTPVFVIGDERGAFKGAFRHVSAIVTFDPENFSSGWGLTLD